MFCNFFNALNRIFTKIKRLCTKYRLIFIIFSIIFAMFPIWGDNLFCAFLQGLTPPLHPAPGTTRSDVTLTRECQRRCGVRLFFGGMFDCSSPFFGEWAIKSSAGLRHNWGIAVFCLRKTLYPKPLNFLFSKNNFIIYPQWEQSDN